VIAFVVTFHGDIIGIAFYGLAYMLMKDRIHDFKPKGIIV